MSPNPSEYKQNKPALPRVRVQQDNLQFYTHPQESLQRCTAGDSFKTDAARHKQNQRAAKSYMDHDAIPCCKGAGTRLLWLPRQQIH
jgi:hypothetical protein